MMAVTGRLDARCSYGAPWRLAWPKAAAYEIPYHVVLQGRAVLEDSETGAASELGGGDTPSVAAFRRMFTARMEMTPGQWRSQAREGCF